MMKTNEENAAPAVVVPRRRRTQRTITLTAGPRDELLALVNHHPREQHPGSAVRLVLEYLGLGQAEYNRVIRGLTNISATTAIRLEIETGIPGRQWMWLQTEYELWHARRALQELYDRP